MPGGWDRLSDSDRRELVALFDPCRDDIDWSEADAQRLDIRLFGEFVDPENARDDALARQQLIEYVESHPDAAFFLDDQKFHICRAHPEARRVISAAHIPASFTCRLRNPTCPFTRALARCPGQSIALRMQGPNG